MARALADVLLRQDSVIATWQIIAAGCDHEMAGREVAAGRWQRPVHGIYFAFSAEPTLWQRAWCARLVGGPSSRISGPLACQLLGIADAPGVAAVVRVPADCRRTSSPDYVVRRTSRLAPGQGERAKDSEGQVVGEEEEPDDVGPQLVDATQAVADATRLAPGLREARAVVCAAMNGKHTTYDELVAERTAQVRRGLALLGHALDDWADGARSAPEAEVADALREQVRRGGMPPFLLNPNVYDGAVLLGALDVYVPGCALGGETDSVRHHGSAAALDATLSRHAVITRSGIHLEHVSPSRFRRSPGGWAAMFAALAEQRRGLGDPSGLRIEPVGPLQDGRRRRRPRAVVV